MRLQQIFPRILAADYDVPAASPECLHLLRRLLCSDPAQRIDIPGIMHDPWCAAPPAQGPGSLGRRWLMDTSHGSGGCCSNGN